MTGAVAAEHPLSCKAGLDILASGGNAYDAAIAVSATLTVVEPHANGLGSDFFAVIHDRHVRSVNASGWAAGSASIDAFRQLGHRTIPRFGPLSSFTVPGLVAAWRLLLDRTTLPLRTLLAPAVKLARRGFFPSRSLVRVARATRPIGDPDWQRLYAGVEVARRFTQPWVAKTLESIARDQGHGFYHGSVARAIGRDVGEKGGFLTARDLDGFEAEWARPLRVRYRGWDVYTTPPNSQGATALRWLKTLERRPLGSANEREYTVHLLATMPEAYAFRARSIGDPRAVPLPADWDRPAPGGRSFGRLPGPGDGFGDTTAFSVSDGRVGISAIQSNYMGFGSGVVIGGYGISLNNRGSYFTLDPTHHNHLEPGRRTFHTLMAVDAVDRDREILLGTMGGDVQPQTIVQILTRVVDRGVSLPAAIAAPRFAYPATIYAGAEIWREPGLPLRTGTIIGRDRSRVGHAHGLSLGATVEVGIDPRGDGVLPIASTISASGARSG